MADGRTDDQAGHGPTRPLDGPSDDAPHPTHRLFHEGVTVGERYRIVRHLASGGMGEVYEAEDTLLRERLALKTIRRAAATDERALERFKREIHLARKVTHPNVCRLFDVGFHRLAGDEPPVLFLTMELLDGETLEDRLVRDGRMLPTEAAPLVAQMISGLAAAHKAGVVHRDFKSANVVLCRDGRAVITDFGLARTLVESADASVTGDGGIVGSPGYMAPEQVDGRAITPATDIYALGVVLYEMVTGQLPFVGESALATAAKRLKEDPVPPGQKVRELDPRWEEAILKCLARDPADRYPTAADAAVGLFGSSTELSRAALVQSGLLPYERPRRLPWVLGATTAAALALALVVLVVPRTPLPLPSTGRRLATARPPKTSVAVVGFRNLSGRADAEWLSTALGEMLTTELGTGELIRTLPSETVSRARRDLALEAEDSFAPDTLEKLRDRIGSDYVLLGSYVALGSGGKLRFDLKLQSAQTGEVIASITETGTEADLVTLVGRVGKSLRERLGVAALTDSQAEAAAAMFPSRPEVIRLYTEGTAALNLLECPKAYDLLGKAVAGDPSFPLARSAYAMAASCVGHHERALVEAKTALALAERLPEHARRAVQAFYYLLDEQWEEAAEVYASLFEVFPENVDYGFRLAHAQASAGQTEALGKTLARMRRLPAPLGQHIRIDHLQLLYDNAKGMPLEQLLDRARALELRAESEGNLPMMGEALLMEMDFRFRRQDWKEIETIARRQMIISRDVGDQDGVILAHVHLAAALRGQGKEADSSRELAAALALAQEIGDTRRYSILRFLQADAAVDAGDLDTARKLVETNVEEAQRHDLRRDAQRYLAFLQLWQGNLPGAEQSARAVRERFVEDGDKDRVADLDAFLAIIAFARGDDTAVARLAAAVKLLDASRFEVSRRWSREHLADMYDRTGHPEEAERLARASEIGHVLVRILARSQRIDEAERELARIRTAPAWGDGAFYRQLRLLVDEAMIHEARGHHAKARQILDDVAARAAAADLVELSIDARLLSGQIALTSGDPDGGRALLDSVAKEARARGYLQLARAAVK
jgi:eukaryotic-like serine/threonine-protein kinase